MWDSSSWNRSTYRINGERFDPDKHKPDTLGGSHSSQSDSPKSHSSQSETNPSGGQNDTQQQDAQRQAEAARQQEIERQKQAQRERAEAEKQAAAQKAADQLAADQKRRDAALRDQQREQAEAEEEERLKNIQDLNRREQQRQDAKRQDAKRQDAQRQAAAERLFTGHVTEERKKRREAQDLIEKNQRDPKNGYHTTPTDPMDAHLRSLETPDQTRNRKHTELAATMWPTGNTQAPIKQKMPPNNPKHTELAATMWPTGNTRPGTPNNPKLPGGETERQQIQQREYIKTLQQTAEDAKREKQLTELQGPNNAKNRRLTHISNTMWPADADGPTTKAAQRKADQALLDRLEAAAVDKEVQKRMASLALQDRYNPGAFDAFLSMADPDWQQAQVSLGADTSMTNTSGQNTSVQNTGHPNMRGAYSPPSGASSSPDPQGQNTGQNTKGQTFASPPKQRPTTQPLSPIEELMAYGSTPQDHSGYTRPALPTSQWPTSQWPSQPTGQSGGSSTNWGGIEAINIGGIGQPGHGQMGRTIHPKDMKLGTDVSQNSLTYGMQQKALDANVDMLPGGEPITWFAAASAVTSANAVGAYGHPINQIGVKDEHEDFLEFIHVNLASFNQPNFDRLMTGQSVPGIDPTLQGRELDYALVELEQKQASKLTDDYFAANPQIDRKQFMQGLSELSTRQFGEWDTEQDFFGNVYNNIVGGLSDPLVSGAMDKHFSDKPYDADNEEHRISVGKAIIDQLRDETMAWKKYF